MDTEVKQLIRRLRKAKQVWYLIKREYKPGLFANLDLLTSKREAISVAKLKNDGRQVIVQKQTYETIWSSNDEK